MIIIGKRNYNFCYNTKNFNPVSSTEIGRASSSYGKNFSIKSSYLNHVNLLMSDIPIFMIIFASS